MAAVTGSLYDAGNVVVGQAVLYVAPPFTPLPPDNSVLFDPTNWCGITLNANGATAATATVVTALGTATTASFNPTTSTAAALQTLLAGLTNVGAGMVNVTAVTGGFKLLFNTALGGVTVTLGGQTGGPATITPALWTPAGATDQGWSFTGTKQTSPVKIEEQSARTGTTMDDQSVSIVGTLAEAVARTWQWSFNATRVDTAASSGQPGKTDLFLSDTIAQYAVALEMATPANPTQFPVRVYIPNTTCLGSPNVAFRRAGGNKRMFAVNFDSACNINQVNIRIITAAALP